MQIHEPVTDKTSEVWREIPRTSGRYEVSNLGRVRSTGKDETIGTILTPGRAGRGYFTVNVRRPGQKSPACYVHALVLEAFIGPRPEGAEASHLNGDMTDNRLSNLAWETPSQNQKRRSRHGTWQRGEANASAKMTAFDVRLARLLKDHGFTYNQISRIIGRPAGTIGEAVRGTTWSHVV